jgi:hypothetical protein
MIREKFLSEWPGMTIDPPDGGVMQWVNGPVGKGSAKLAGYFSS